MGKSLSKIDEKLLRLANRSASPAEMAEDTGIPATQCLARVREILNERDWLTDLERQKMNIIDLQKVKATLMKQVDQQFADTDAIDVFVKATKVMDDLLDKQAKITDEQLSVVTAAQANALLSLLTKAWDAAVTELETRYPDVDVKELTDVFHEGLREGAKSYE